MPLIGSEHWASADKAHRFRRCLYDDYCECRMSANYRAHQGFWWRLFNPNKMWRT